MFKKIHAYTKALSNKTLALFATVNAMVLSLIPGPVLAVLPAANTVSDGASTTSPIQMFRDFGSRGTTIAATVIAAIVVLGIGYHVYSSFVTSREKGDWKGFGITASAGVVVGAATVVMALLAVQYAA
jgi:hypothetical protein